MAGLSRKVIYKEYLHHPNGNTYNNSSTAYLCSNTADVWTVTYNSITGGYISPVANDTEMYLTNYDSFSSPGQMIFECAVTPIQNIDENGPAEGDEGVGFIFMSTQKGSDGILASYRLRMTDTYIYLERATAGVWSELGKYSYPAVNSTKYYLRVLYAYTGLSMFGHTSNLTAGKFMVYATDVEGNYGSKLTNVSGTGTEVDGSPILAGYMGFYIGANGLSGSPDANFHYMACYRIWDLDVTEFKYSHEISMDSKASLQRVRNPWQIRSSFWDDNEAPYSIGDRVELVVFEDDRENGIRPERIVFDGKVDKLPDFDVSGMRLVGHTVEMAERNWQKSTQTGQITTTVLNDVLPEDGGTTSKEPVTPDPAHTYVLHRNNIDTTNATNTNRKIQGVMANISISKLLNEIGYFYFLRPDGRFFIRGNSIDESQNIDSRDTTLNILGYDSCWDGEQIVNDVDGYHDSWSSPTNKNDSTSLGSYGPRGMTRVDMHQMGSTVSDNSNQEKINNYKGNKFMVKVKLLQQKFDVYPGNQVGVVLAGTKIGTVNYAQTPGSWSPYPMTVNKCEYDSATGIHEIMMVEARAGSTRPFTRAWPFDRDSLGIGRDLGNLYSQDT